MNHEDVRIRRYFTADETSPTSNMDRAHGALTGVVVVPKPSSQCIHGTRQERSGLSVERYADDEVRATRESQHCTYTRTACQSGLTSRASPK